MMNAEPQHPSFFTLDRVALGLTVSASVAEHVERCECCSAHVADMRRRRPVPAWARQAARPRLPRRIWAGGMVGVTLATAVALLVYRPASEGHESAYTTARGAPSVGLYIKRGQRVFLWDGRQPIAAGDRLRLKVVPEGFTHVGVFATAASSPEQARLLFASDVAPDEESLLPRAWEVDDTPGSETLVIVLGRQPVDARDLARLQERSQQPSGWWMRTLHLSKNSGTRDSVLDSGRLEGEP